MYRHAKVPQQPLGKLDPNIVGDKFVTITTYEKKTF